MASARNAMKQRLQLCFDTKASFGAQAAFTLVELVTVVTIVGVIAAIAVPSFASLIVGQRAGSAATDIYIALATARSEATKRNASVTLLPAAHSPCSSAIWKCGWTIADPDPTLTTPRNLLDHDALSNASITTTPSSLSSVVYQSSGRIAGATKPSFAITMTSGSASASKYVCLDLSGRPFVQNTACP
jgi:type IV fimbrial biogenesis protein FimT